MNRDIARLFLAAGWLVVVPASVAAVADVFNPQNGHVYRLIQFPELRWADARLGAASQSLGGAAGYLATITSGEEQAFVQSSFLAALQPWGAWLGGFQPVGSAEPAGNWLWVTSAAFGYANWHPSGEPSNANNNENQLQLLNNGYWNDLGTSETVGSPLYDLPYIVEFNVPEPASFWMALTAIYVAGGGRRHRQRRRFRNRLELRTEKGG